MDYLSDVEGTFPERVILNEGNQAHQDAESGESEGIRRKGRLRRVPGFLPVGLQDLLHCC